MKTTVKLKPLADRLVARALAAETKTASGILLTSGTAEKAKPELADVVAVGIEVEEVKVGDRIVYEKYGPETFKQDGEELLILKEEDVLAVAE